MRFIGLTIAVLCLYIPSSLSGAIFFAAKNLEPSHQSSSPAPLPSYLEPSEVNLHLGISGNGYFLLRSPTTGEEFVTRYGNFRLDAEGYIVTSQNLRLQGFYVPILTNQSFSSASPIGDLQIANRNHPSELPEFLKDVPVMRYEVERDGRLIAWLSNGYAYVQGQIVLRKFARPALLSMKWLHIFDNLDQAERAGLVVPDPTNATQILHGYLNKRYPEHPSGLLLDKRPDHVRIWFMEYNRLSTVLETSEDLQVWQPVFTNQFGEAEFFSDARAATQASRFYRIQQTISITHNPTDLAIDGKGFFLVRDPLTSTSYVTRFGSFRINPDGFLVTPNGLRLQGHHLPPSAGANGDYGQHEPIGDLQFNKGDILFGLPPSADTAVISSMMIDSNGKLQILLSDGSQLVRGQVLLQWFENPEELKHIGDRAWSFSAQSRPLPRPVMPFFSGTGRIVSGGLNIYPDRW